MYKYALPFLFIFISILLYVALFNRPFYTIYQHLTFNQYFREKSQESINTSKDVYQKLVFLNDKNLNSSFIRIHLEADITPNIEYFINNNKQYFEKDNNSNLIKSNEKNLWRSITSIGMKIQSSMKEIFFIFISQLTYNSQVNYLYIEAFTQNYRQISYNWSVNNTTIVRIPSILFIDQLNISECCSKLLNLDKNEMMFVFNQQNKLELYNLLTHHQTSLLLEKNLTLNLKTTLTPFVKNNKLHFIYSYKPLNILQCSKNEIQCNIISKKIEFNDNFDIIIQDGTQLIQYDDTDYFIGISSIAVSCNQCTNFYRPHIIILSTILDEFRLIYISEPLKIDDFPIFSSFLKTQEYNSSDFCYGIIRTMTPRSIIDWDWSSDTLSFTLSINFKKIFLVRIDGIGKFIQSFMYTVKNESSPFSNALQYCENLTNINKLKYEKMLIEKEYLKTIIIKDIVNSSTYPTFQIVSNTDQQSMKGWIEYDFVHYGLIGRYLTQFNLQRINNLMIDAGGNHGMYSLYGAMLNQTVYVFEILPKYWIVIEESIRINVNIDERIVLYKCGVSDQYDVWNVFPDDGTNRLIYPEMNLTEKYILSNESQQNLTIIEGYPLDNFIFQRISVMKIDVEGFEIRALKGAFRAISVFGVGAILIEIVPNRWIWNNVTIDEGISVLEHVTFIGHYLPYIITRDTNLCPVSNISNITGMIEITDLTMMNMTDGHLESAPSIYQITDWRTIITHMNYNDWGCNFWLESII